MNRILEKIFIGLFWLGVYIYGENIVFRIGVVVKIGSFIRIIWRRRGDFLEEK